jgi:4,5-DOPA dioxygenase extradiol
MPALFTGHGSPMNIIQENGYTRSLVGLAASLPRPASVLVVSAHWLTRGTFVTVSDRPRQIYDFGGFPDELYEIRYEPAGAPGEARRLIEGAGGAIRPDTGEHEWGLDHASWSVLRHMYPNADVPVWQMSLDMERPIADHLAIARSLAPLRDRGVLVMASGNLVHNLRLIDFRDDAKALPWAIEADAWVRDRLVADDRAGLLDYRNAGSAVARAVPTPDHYLPVLYALGLREEGESLSFTFEGIQNGSISMRGFRIG